MRKTLNKQLISLAALAICLIILIYFIFLRMASTEDISRRLPDGYRGSVLSGKVIAEIEKPASIKMLKPNIAEAKSKDELAEDKFDSHVKHIPDYRPEACKSCCDAEIPATLIIDFFDYSFYDMKMTLTSVRLNSPLSLIREIIIVDDGSTLQYIINESIDYVTKMSSIMKMTLLRNENRKGQGFSRMRAAKEAITANLIFLDPQAILNKGWLEPLVAHIQKFPNALATPHMDEINDPISYKYSKTKDNLAFSFAWNMQIHPTLRKDGNATMAYYPSPTLRGDVFAISREFFFSIGGLDDHLSDGGGYMLEFSYRMWLCGGKIHVVPCSRIGVLNVHNPVTTFSHVNIWHIIQLWIKDRGHLVQKHIGDSHFGDIKDVHQEILAKRKEQLKNLKCNDFSWYVENIAVDLYEISADSKHFGILVVKNGLCAHVSQDQTIELGSCMAQKFNLVRQEMVFEITRDGQFKWSDTCLTVTKTNYIRAKECDEHNENQFWTYNKEKRLVNKKTKFCATHVTDPDPAFSKRQIVMAQECGDLKKTAEFASWTFAKP